MFDYVLRRFRTDAGGASTVDWVALTAGVLLLGIVVILMVGYGMDDWVGDINQEFQDHRDSQSQ